MKNVPAANKEETKSLTTMEWSKNQIELIKKTVAKGTTDDELKLFLYTCKRTGLDPLIRQIYAVKRGGKSDQMTIQTGIDGYRLVAERTGKYAPGKEPSYIENEKGTLISATAYVKKFIKDEWHEVAATARFAEYKQESSFLWPKMPYLMLAKCAESLALRRAFPAEMCGVYTTDEMAQGDNKSTTTSTKPPQSKSKPKSETGDEKVTCFITEVKESNGTYKTGKDKGKKYVRSGIVCDNDIIYGTFDEALGTFAKKCVGSEVEIDYEQNGGFFNATNITPIEQQD